MDYTKIGEEISKYAAYELVYKTEETKKHTSKISIEEAGFLIYDWPDDKEGANTSIPVSLNFYFTLEDKEYQIGTKNTFYDYNVKAYQMNTSHSYIKDIYPFLVKKALEVSKEKIEEILGVSLSEVAPFNTQETKANSLSNTAIKACMIDTI